MRLTRLKRPHGNTARSLRRRSSSPLAGALTSSRRLRHVSAIAATACLPPALPLVAGFPTRPFDLGSAPIDLVPACGNSRHREFEPVDVWFTSRVPAIKVCHRQGQLLCSASDIIALGGYSFLQRGRWRETGTRKACLMERSCAASGGLAGTAGRKIGAQNAAKMAEGIRWSRLGRRCWRVPFSGT